MHVFDFVCASGQMQRAYVDDENGYSSSQGAERGCERRTRPVEGGNVIGEKEKESEMGMQGEREEERERERAYELEAAH